MIILITDEIKKLLVDQKQFFFTQAIFITAIWKKLVNNIDCFNSFQLTFRFNNPINT